MRFAIATLALLAVATITVSAGSPPVADKVSKRVLKAGDYKWGKECALKTTGKNAGKKGRSGFLVTDKKGADKNAAVQKHFELNFSTDSKVWSKKGNAMKKAYSIAKQGKGKVVFTFDRKGDKGGPLSITLEKKTSKKVKPGYVAERCSYEIEGKKYHVQAKVAEQAARGTFVEVEVVRHDSTKKAAAAGKEKKADKVLYSVKAGVLTVHKCAKKEKAAGAPPKPKSAVSRRLKQIIHLGALSQCIKFNKWQVNKKSCEDSKKAK